LIVFIVAFVYWLEIKFAACEGVEPSPVSALNAGFISEQFPACTTLQGAKFGASIIGVLYGSLDVLVSSGHIRQTGFMVNTSPHNIGRRGLSGIHKGNRNATDK